ncbi:hypothetical protein RCH10_005194 [Variovorax sp. GrIS 2.14]
MTLQHGVNRLNRYDSHIAQLLWLTISAESLRHNAKSCRSTLVVCLVVGNQGRPAAEATASHARDDKMWMGYGVQLRKGVDLTKASHQYWSARHLNRRMTEHQRAVQHKLELAEVFIKVATKWNPLLWKRLRDETCQIDTGVVMEEWAATDRDTTMQLWAPVFRIRKQAIRSYVVVKSDFYNFTTLDNMASRHEHTIANVKARADGCGAIRRLTGDEANATSIL